MPNNVVICQKFLIFPPQLFNITPLPTSNSFIRFLYRRLSLIQLGIDLLLLNAFFYFIIVQPFYRLGDPLLTNSLVLIGSTLNIGWFIFFLWYRIHKVERRPHNLQNYLEGLIQAILLFGLIGWLLWSIAYKPETRPLLFISFLFYYVLSIVLWRLVVYWVITYSRTLGYNTRNAVILGYCREGRAIERYLKAHPELGYRFTGYFDGQQNGEKIKGTLKELYKHIEQADIQVMYCCLSQSEVNMDQIMALADRYFIKVYVVPRMNEQRYVELQPNSYEGLPVLGIQSTPLDKSWNRIVKRGFDVCVSLVVALFLLSWMIPLIGLIIRLQSQGPMLYTHKRQGRKNKPFMCIKFRTMYWDGGYYADLPQQTSRDDVRVTPIGRFLRRTSLDELPQFLNVLLGDMSVVGPRPHTQELNKAYDVRIKNLWARQQVKPGVTGLAQARGYRGEIQSLYDIQGRVRLDNFYIHHWSFILDVRIIITTIYILLRGQAAY